MRSQFELLVPGDVEARITLTATISEWRELRQQLNERWPSGELSRLLYDVIGQAEAKFQAPT